MEQDFVKDFRRKFQQAVDVAVEARFKNEERRLMSTLGQDIAKILQPTLLEVAQTARANKENIREVMQELMATANAREYPGVDTGALIQAIEVAFGKVLMPQPKVTVNTPKVDIPPLNWPDGEMPIKGWVNLMGVDMMNPLPVQIRDAKGRPVNLDLTQVVSGGGGFGGGKHDFFTIKGFNASAYADYLNADNRLRVSVESGSTGLTDTELRAAHLDVQQVSGSVDSTNLVQVGGNSVVVGTGYQDNALRVVHATDAAASVYVIGASGTISANVVDSGGIPYTTTNPLPIGDAGGSITIDGTVSISGSITSTVVTGPTVADAADDGAAPVQMGGVARQANPGAVAAGDVVKTSHDDLGRILTRPVQVRDLIQTAWVQLTTGTETTLRAAVAGAYLDLIYIMGANNSDAAVSVNIRPVTAGNVVLTLQIPASGTAGIACPVPLPQTDTGNNWTADMTDITGTTVSLTALFTQEV